MFFAIFGFALYLAGSVVADKKGPEIQPQTVPYTGNANSNNLPFAKHGNNKTDEVKSGEIDAISTNSVGNQESATTPWTPVNSVLEPAVPEQSNKDCQPGQKVAFFVAPAYELAYPADTLSIVVNDTDDDFCAILCTDNIVPSGKPIQCQSYSYFPFDKKCVMHTAKAYPNGRGRLAYNKNVIYSEKFCLPVGAPGYCPAEEIFLEFPKLNVMGFNVDVHPQVTHNMAACMQLCIVNSEHCRSIVYQAEMKLCYLKGTDFTSNPAAFEEDSASTFFVENGCVTNSVDLEQNIQPGTSNKKSENVKKSTEIEVTTQQPSVDYVVTAQDTNYQYQDQNSQQQEEQYIDEYTDVASDYHQGASGSNKPWGDWTGCQFEVVGHVVRVRTQGCDIFECQPGELEVERCNEGDLSK